jgi:hypothetical protein
VTELVGICKQNPFNEDCCGKAFIEGRDKLEKSLKIIIRNTLLLLYSPQCITNGYANNLLKEETKYQFRPPTDHF